MPHIEKLLISPIFLLCVLLLTVLAGWLFAIKIFAPGNKFWRIANFCGLSFTCLGILGVVKDSRQIFYEREYYRCQRRIEGQYKWQLISNFNEDYYCREFVETENSPENIRLIQEDYNTTCQWIKENKKYLSQCYYKLEQISIDSISYPTLLTTNQILEDYFRNIQQTITEYNNDITELKEYERGQQPNTFELFYIVFTPLLLAIGLGWKFVKFLAGR